MLDKQTQKVQKRYDRISYFYDILERIIEKWFFEKWRKNLLKKINGKILEVGVGTGKNLQYYHKNAKVIAIDLSLKMLTKARLKLKKLKNKNVKLIQMDAQKLKFKNNSFDYVVCTFVLCSVPDPLKTLKEIKRVLKKTGSILMIEHILSKNTFIAFFQHIHNPLTRILLGVNINRKTLENIEKAGFKIKKQKNLAFLDVFKKIEVMKN